MSMNTFYDNFVLIIIWTMQIMVVTIQLKSETMFKSMQVTDESEDMNFYS